LIVNSQKRISVNLVRMREYLRRLRSALRLDGRDFNICIVDDQEIRKLNAAYRGKAQPTDVLSFPWEADDRNSGLAGGAGSEFEGFLGDVVISAPTALRNARAAGHSTANEIRWLILHGVLHLLGYDHETDRGEMTALELELRQKPGIAGKGQVRRRESNLLARKGGQGGKKLSRAGR
jgi:probable rRNA maturation factor